ncbi:MAG: DnaA N-terminal domain-containing protein, partial [Dongiaceae bacterium]
MTELNSDSMLNAQWARVRGRLRAEFGEATFRSWLKPLNLAGKRGPDLRVSVPSRFMRDWVATHYADRLKALWSSENPEVRSVEVIVDAHRPVHDLELDTLDNTISDDDAPANASPIPAMP